MGTMRNNLLESFLLLWLMATGQATLPYSYKEISSSRNNLVDRLSTVSQSISQSTPTYECLYINSDLPPCDVERMLDSEEDITHSTMDYRKTNGSPENFGNYHSFRSRRNADDSARRHVIVYTIEGCLPPRLPFAMPFCQVENSFDKIIEVRKLYPFTVKGLTKAPLVFPEFNFDRWIRMMKRLRDHAASTTNDKKHRDATPKGMPIDEISDHRTEPFGKAAKGMSQKAMIADRKVSKSSSTKEFIVHNQKKGRTNDKQEEIKELPSTVSEKAKGKEPRDSSASLRIQKTNDDLPRRSFEDSQETVVYKKNEEEPGKKTNPYSNLFYSQEPKVFRKNDETWEGISTQEEETGLEKGNDEVTTSTTISDIPIASVYLREPHTLVETDDDLYEQSDILDLSAKDFRHVVNPNHFRNSLNDEIQENYEKEEDPAHLEINGFNANDLSDSSELIAHNVRKRREIRLAKELARQSLRRESKEERNSAQLHVQRSRRTRETVNSRRNKLDVDSKWNRYTKSKDTTGDKYGIARGYRSSLEPESLKSAIPRDASRESTFRPRSDFLNPPKDFQGKIGILNNKFDQTSRKGSTDGIAARKKYGSYSKIVSKYGRRSRRQ